MAKKDTSTKDSLGGEFVPAGPEHEEHPEPVDVDHERNLKVTAMMEDGFYDRLARDASYGTTHDGLGEVPSHREGEVWESTAPEDDDVGGGRRRVRVQSVEQGEVVAVNVVTGHVSRFQSENLTEPRWRRAHS